jgi:hypothetical protein
MQCEHCQLHLWDHLYGLLDDVALQQTVTAHVQSCATCRQAWETAQTQQQLLARAAKAEGIDIVFTVPAEEAVSAVVEPSRNSHSPLNIGLLPQKEERWGRLILPWAFAASLLLAVGIGFFMLQSSRYETAAAKAQARQTELAQEKANREAEKKRREAEYQRRNDAFTKLGLEQQAAVQQLRQQHAAGQFYLSVSGTRAFEAGAPNSLRVKTQDLAQRPIPTDLQVCLLDQHHKPLGQNPRLHIRTVQPGEYVVDFPADFVASADQNLFVEVQAKAANGAQQRLVQPLKYLKALYLTHLATDKPLYHPGETVRFRSLTLDRFSFKPVQETLYLEYIIHSPRGEKVFSQSGPAVVLDPTTKKPLHGPDGKPLLGVGCGEFTLPADLPGGEYTLQVREQQDRFQPQVRKFLVSQYQTHRLNKQLEFSKTSYGPGEEVLAACKVTALGNESKPLAGLPVQAWLNVDGTKLEVPELRTDSQGGVTIKAKLPAEIKRGDVTLSVLFTDGANRETLVKPVPVVLHRLYVQFFPEGGDLVAGVPNRVYFHTRTTLDKPAELQAKLLDETGQTVATLATFNDPKNPGANQGVGSFIFTPQRGRKYTLKAVQPAGISLLGEGLPKVEERGIVLHLPQAAVEGSAPLHVTLHNRGPEKKVLVGAYCRGFMMAHQTATLGSDSTLSLDLPLEQQVGGVYRVTVFEERVFGSEKLLVPVAERLTYRITPQQLRVNLTAQRQRYFPGERANLQLQTTNEKNEPTAAIALMAVVDKSVLAMADEKSARAMPTFFLLTNELRKPDDLEHTDFLLSDHPQAAQALDYLLGTQGWRRFAEQDPQEFRKRELVEADRLLQLEGQTPLVRDTQQQLTLQIDAAIQDKLAQVKKDFAAKQAAASKQVIEARRALAAATNPQETQRLEQEQEQSRLALAYAESGWDQFREHFQAASWLVAVVAGFVALILALSHFFNVWMARTAPEAAGKLRFLRTARVLSMAGAILCCLGIPAFFREHFFGLFGSPEMPTPPSLMEVANGNGHKKVPDQPMYPLPGRLTKDQPVVDPTKAPREAPADKRPPQDAGKQQQQPAGGKKPVATQEPFILRQYAHVHPQGSNLSRQDWTETLFWHPVLVLPNGQGNVSFDLSDALTTFQATVYAFSLDGRLGAGKLEIESRLPFSVEPKVPVEVTASDKIDIPVSLTNGTDDRRDVSVRTKVAGLTLVGSPEQTVTLAPQQNGRLLFSFQPALGEGEAKLQIEGQAGPFTDSIIRTFRVVPDGFPVLGAHSDLLERSASREILLPERWLKGTLQLRAQVYPSTLADLQKGLEGLLREPHGCFEQTSSTNYPNALTLNYLRESNQSDPATTRRARELLDKGYQKLVAFECDVQSKQEGFEWFGGKGVMPHEALTAYGLMQFHDMARVHPVDEGVLQRTRQYLLSRRNGQGGFQRNPKALDRFGRASEQITNAYILWALSETGSVADLEKEIAALQTQAAAAEDPYFLALVANVLLNANQPAEGVSLLHKLVKLQQPDGHLTGKTLSITGSTGRDLQIETTALALLGWLKANRPAEFTSPIQTAVKWLTQQRGSQGTFGATQSTVLALKALIAFTRSQKRPAEAGELTLLVNGRAVGRLAFTAQQQEALEILLPDAEEVLKPGKNDVRLEITTQSPLPYTLAWSYRTLQPVSAAQCPVQLTTKLDRTIATEGETVRLQVTLKNVSGQGQGMATAIIGLPAGLSLPEDLKQLKDYTRLQDDETRPGRIAAFELRSRELVLYWRDLAPDAMITLPIDLVCRLPGTYRGPASRAYLYYNADQKHWTDPLQVQIKAVP